LHKNRSCHLEKFRYVGTTRNLSLILMRYKISPFGRNDNFIIM